MEGQKRLLRRLSVRGVESDKPSVCIGRITTQFVYAVQQKNPQSSTTEIGKSKIGWALDVAHWPYNAQTRTCPGNPTNQDLAELRLRAEMSFDTGEISRCASIPPGGPW